LKDVFAVQEDVARAIAASLQVPLGLKNGENLIRNRTISPEAYQQYLRARALIQSRGFGNSVAAAIDILQQIVVREPDYAPAWALLAQAYSLAAINNPATPSISVQQLHRATDENSARAEKAARQAIELDPRNAEPYIALARIHYMQGRLLEMDEADAKALSLDPLNSELLHAYSHALALVGRFDDAIAMRRQISEIDPLVPIFNAITARMLWSVGENQKALAAAEALPSGYSGRGLTLAIVYAGMGRYKDAADAAATTPREAYPPNVVDAAVRLLRGAPGRAPRENFPELGVFSFAFAYAGDLERTLAQHEFLTAGNSDGERHEIWQPALRPLRNTPRFKALVRKMGLIEYWNARGWPNFCHPTTADDFACE
jgi:tetratricopeptide (TPR) repeat protein